MRVGGARPPPFTLVTITCKVAVYVPAERADTLRLYILCGQYELATPVLGQPILFSWVLHHELSPFLVLRYSVFRYLRLPVLFSYFTSYCKYCIIQYLRHPVMLSFYRP